MPITNIKVENFRSFETLDVRLGNFTVVIGPNASGKSNFLQLFAFIRDATARGLDNAMSLQGGPEQFRNLKIGTQTPTFIEVDATSELQFVNPFVPQQTRVNGIIAKRLNYRTRITHAGGEDYGIPEEKLTVFCEVTEFGIDFQRQPVPFFPQKSLAPGQVVFERKNGRVEVTDDLGSAFSAQRYFNFPPEQIPEHALFFQHPLLVPFAINIGRGAMIYDFEPRLARRAIPLQSLRDLQEDGGNVAVALRNILSHPERSRMILNLLKDVLPFIKNLEAKVLSDRSVLLHLAESYVSGQHIPAPLMSDGTLYTVGMLIALFFENSMPKLFEEPDRFMHPSLIRRMMALMKDLPRNKQLLMTSHNPEVVKNAGIENLLLISRDSEGFSRISRPQEKEAVRVFLQNEIGVEDLFVKGLL